MGKYSVVWRTEVDAEDPIEAAAKALEVQSKEVRTYTPVRFTVSSPAGYITEVEITESAMMAQPASTPEALWRDVSPEIREAIVEGLQRDRRGAEVESAHPDKWVPAYDAVIALLTGKQA